MASPAVKASPNVPWISMSCVWSGGTERRWGVQWAVIQWIDVGRPGSHSAEAGRSEQKHKRHKERQVQKMWPYREGLYTSLVARPVQQAAPRSGGRWAAGRPQTGPTDGAGDRCCQALMTRIRGCFPCNCLPAIFQQGLHWEQHLFWRQKEIGSLLLFLSTSISSVKQRF